MKFLPYERITIRTRLSSKEAGEKLHEVIEPKRFVRWFEVKHKPYQGDINDSHFEVARVIHYRTPSLPIIKGEIQPEARGCSVHITMCPAGAVVALVMVQLGIIGYYLLSAIVSVISAALQGATQDPSRLLIPGGLFVLVYTFFVGLFKFESIQSKEFFRELLQAEEVEEMGIAYPFTGAG
jgi:hypothetical protein